MNRMFQVIVLGGISLAGPACGSTVKEASQGATSGAGGAGGGFPQEGAGGSFPQEGFMAPSSSSSSGFPQEGAASSSSTGTGPFDAGTDAPGCFPDETDVACDAGAPVDAG